MTCNNMQSWYSKSEYCFRATRRAKSNEEISGMKDRSKVETYSETETEARREAALKTIFSTPHKPHKASKKGGKESREK